MSNTSVVLDIIPVEGTKTVEKYCARFGVVANIVNPYARVGGWPEIKFTGSSYAIDNLVKAYFEGK